jgi:hypothetical protein
MAFIVGFLIILNMIRLVGLSLGYSIPEIPSIVYNAPVIGAETGETSCFIFFTCNEASFWAGVSRFLTVLINVIIMVVNLVAVMVTIPLFLLMLDIPVEMRSVMVTPVIAGNIIFVVKLIRRG